MEFKLVENPFIPGYFRNGTAGCIGLNDGSNQGFRLIYGWQQLYPQNQFHPTQLKHFLNIKKDWQFLPDTYVGVSLPVE
jgi:hypothetical protein